MDFEKIIVAPQIVIYKNIFKHSKELINLLEDDNEDSLFCSWSNWYEQGYRKNVEYDLQNVIKLEDSVYSKKEKFYLSELCSVFNFVKKDYFDQFEKNKGIWPNFIKDWDEVKKEKQVHFFEYFKYDILKEINNQPVDYAMDYHVDEYLTELDIQMIRHVATANLYLNNEYSGGEICAYDSVSDKSYKYKPQPGDIVIMPSTKPFYHAVKFFSGYDRYFLRSFFDYRSEGSIDFEKFTENFANYINNDYQKLFVPTVEEVIK